MTYGIFAKLDQNEGAAVLEDVNPVLEGSIFDPKTASVLVQDLPFYPGFRLLEITDFETTPHNRKFAIHRPGQAIALDWSNKPIYDLNKIAPLTLDNNNVGDYVRFFFTYVRGQHGRFIITENVNDMAWRDEPPPAELSANC